MTAFYFDVGGVLNIGVAKPSAEFFNSASKMINSSEIVFVDDRVVHVEAARRFGWTAMQTVHGWVARFERAYLDGPRGLGFFGAPLRFGSH